MPELNAQATEAARKAASSFVATDLDGEPVDGRTAAIAGMRSSQAIVRAAPSWPSPGWQLAGLAVPQQRTGEAFIMSEPAATAGGFVLWKIGGLLLGVGVISSALGFLVLWPKTAREAFARALATMIGSALFGPFVVAAAYAKWPTLFAAGGHLALQFGQPEWVGLFMAGAPLIAMAGLPLWWIVGAVVLYFEKRRGKDIGELAADVRNDIKGAVSP